MILVLSAYKRRANDALVSEWEMPIDHLEEIQKLFGLLEAHDDDLITSSEVVTPEQQEYVESLTGISLDLRRNSYWVEAFADTGKSESLIGPNGEPYYLAPRSLPGFPDAVRVRPR